MTTMPSTRKYASANEIKNAVQLIHLKSVKYTPSGELLFSYVPTQIPDKLYTRDALDAIDARILLQLDYQHNKGFPSGILAEWLSHVLVLWDAPDKQRIYDEFSQQWLVWDSIFLDNHNNVYLQTRAWSGTMIDGHPISTSRSHLQKFKKTDVAMNVRYPGILKNIEIATALGLTQQEAARYCFQMHYYPTSTNDISLPQDDLTNDR